MAERKNLTDANVAELEKRAKKYEVWDAKLPHLCVRVEVSGKKTFYFVYSIGGRTRWLRIGPAAMRAAEARTEAKKLIGDVARGGDPQAERMARRGGLTFEQLHTRYVEEWAKKRNKSWRQPDNLIRTRVLPRWAKLRASEIRRVDVRLLIGSIAKPILANQVKAAISAVFSFAVKHDLVVLNPCKGVDDNPTNSRDRVLSDTEVPLFWAGCDQVDPVKAAALRVVLLTGQRPGEVCCMRREHIKDNWWQLPGEPQPELLWPGTKNKQGHRVWLSAKVRELIGNETEGLVFANERGNPIDDLDVAMRAISELMGLEPAVTPHDLRRTMGSTITGRAHGREAMDRILNHRKKSVTDVYDRHDYARADKLIMEDVAGALMRLVEGREQDNVIALARGS